MDLIIDERREYRDVCRKRGGGIGQDFGGGGGRTRLGLHRRLHEQDGDGLRRWRGTGRPIRPRERGTSPQFGPRFGEPCRSGPGIARPKSSCLIPAPNGRCQDDVEFVRREGTSRFDFRFDEWRGPVISAGFESVQTGTEIRFIPFDHVANDAVGPVGVVESIPCDQRMTGIGIEPVGLQLICVLKLLARTLKVQLCGKVSTELFHDLRVLGMLSEEVFEIFRRLED